MNQILPVLLVVGFGAARGGGEQAVAPALWSLVESERAFSRTCVERGVREAWLSFMADDTATPIPREAR